MPELLSQRGSAICRVCSSTELVSVLNLGSHPLPSEYGFTSEQVLDEFPLELKICQHCGLGQIGEYVIPERIFHKKYPYLSSASTTWIDHARNFAVEMADKLGLDESTLVLELASNDGYLLCEFAKLGIPVLGVEPAENVAKIAEDRGVPTIVGFFGEEMATNILEKYGVPKLISANNVFAHIPDMNDFTAGLSILSDATTTITIENPSFTTLLSNGFFDTIYHEHYSYLTAHSVREVARNHSLDLSKVERLSTHGGSNRYWLTKNSAIDSSVGHVLSEEIEFGLFDPSTWTIFSNKVNKTISAFKQWICERRLNSDIVVAYGAAHKGNTFLNSVGKESKYLSYIVDASFEKQGKFLPGSQIPVLAPEQLNHRNPTDIIILPWNIAGEIKNRIKTLAPNARIWVAQPELKQIS